MYAHLLITLSATISCVLSCAATGSDGPPVVVPITPVAPVTPEAPVEPVVPPVDPVDPEPPVDPPGPVCLQCVDQVLPTPSWTDTPTVDAAGCPARKVSCISDGEVRIWVVGRSSTESYMPDSRSAILTCSELGWGVGPVESAITIFCF